MSLISRLRAVVAGDDYLDSDYDELDYETGDHFESDERNSRPLGGELATMSESDAFDFEDGISELINNINYWKNAPLWNKSNIKKATKNWFKYLKNE